MSISNHLQNSLFLNIIDILPSTTSSFIANCKCFFKIFILLPDGLYLINLVGIPKLWKMLIIHTFVSTDLKHSPCSTIRSQDIYSNSFTSMHPIRHIQQLRILNLFRIYINMLISGV